MDYALQLLKREAATGSQEAIARYIAALERAVGGIPPLPPPIEKGEYPDYSNEAVVQTIHGTQLRCPAYPHNVDYLRVCDYEGNEIAFWSVDEWRVVPQDGAHYDPNDGEVESMDVIGAIVGALLGGLNA